MNDKLTYSFRGNLRGRVVVCTTASDLTVRERERERAVLAFKLLTALAQSLTGRFELLVGREVRLDDRAGLVLRDGALEFFYSSF